MKGGGEWMGTHSTTTFTLGNIVAGIGGTLDEDRLLQIVVNGFEDSTEGRNYALQVLCSARPQQQ